MVSALRRSELSNLVQYGKVRLDSFSKLSKRCESMLVLDRRVQFSDLLKDCPIEIVEYLLTGELDFFLS